MLTLISLNNFKSYLGSSLPLAPLSIIIGANASGKSNALEAIRLLSWLAKGGRLDDIERNFLGNNLFIRGQGDDLFYSSNKSFKLSCSITNIINSWDLTIEIGLCGEQLVVISKEIKQNRLDKFPLSLYKIIGKPNPHTDEISVQYNNFLRGKNKPHIPCSNSQAIFYQLETPARFDKSHLKAQHEIPAACRAFRENLRNIVFLDPRPSLMHDYSYIKELHQIIFTKLVLNKNGNLSI